MADMARTNVRDASARRPYREPVALFGIETETSIVPVSGRPYPDVLLGAAASALFRDLSRRHHSSNVFLENGARLYLDVGSHPEYATPECSSLRQLVAAVKAGERVLSGMVRSAVPRFAEAGLQPADIVAISRDPRGNVSGCHENYLIARENAPGDFSVLRDSLLAFFVSRQLICGAGHVDQTPGGPPYRVSQRYDAFAADSGSGTTNNHRSIFNTRDEAHADAEVYRRLHVIAGDANMSEWSTFLKVGSTQLVLDMISAGTSFTHLLAASPLQAIAELSGDPTAATTVLLSDGSRLDGATMQRRFLDAALAHVAAGKPTSLEASETSQVLGMWQEAVVALESHDMTVISRDLGTKVDWVIKLRLIDQYLTHHGLTMESPKAAQLGIEYHRLSDRGLFSMLERRGRVERITEEAEIEELVTSPPATTRAALRGAFLKAGRAAGIDVRAGWDKLIYVLGATQRDISLPDPLATENGAVHDVIADFGRRASLHTGLG